VKTKDVVFAPSFARATKLTATPPNSNQAIASGIRMEDAEHQQGAVLDKALLAKVLLGLADADLIPLRAVSTDFLSLVDQALRQHFLERWSVASVTGASGVALARCRLHNFAAVHRLAPRDSLAAVALLHGTHTHTLRRCNNVLSEQTLASRAELYVPVADAAALRGRAVALVRCPASTRCWMALEAACERPPPAPALATPRQADQARARLSALMQRALRVDPAAAAFYLAACGGDIRAAMAAHQEDQRWERSAGELRRSLLGGRRPR
jgi:hypothetical protein